MCLRIVTCHLEIEAESHSVVLRVIVIPKINSHLIMKLIWSRFTR